MYTEEGFLDALRQTPDDDDLRLVFSDWLEDQDDGRADFLRLQIRKRRVALDDPAYAEVLNEADALIVRGRRGWLAPLAEYGINVMQGSGLLQLVLTAEQLRDLDPADQAAPAWRWVDGLRIYRLDSETLEDTLHAPGLAHFRHLDLSRPGWGIQVLPALLTAALPRVVSLDLEDANLTHEAGRILAEAPWLPRLRGLNLARNNLGDVALRDLVTYGNFDALRVLDLRGCGLGELALLVLVGATFFSRLHALSLENNKLGNKGARVLLRSPHLAQLRALDLRGNDITIGLQRDLRKQCPAVIL